MKLFSADNPFLYPIILLFVGLIGFLFIQIGENKLNNFSILFLLYSIIFLCFMYYWALLLEKKALIKVIPVNNYLTSILLVVKIFLISKFILAESVNTFDDRLSVYGSSFLLGLDIAITSFIFPFLAVFSKTKLARSSVIIVWIISITFTCLLAPSKAYFLKMLFDVLTYRFYLRKKTGIGRPLKIFSVKFIIPFFLAIIATFILLYTKLGNTFWFVLLDRIAKNFDIAIYASEISDKIPPHSNLFYAILPLLTKFDSSLYMLDFNKIPQWVVCEALGIKNGGRYGYPNDNMIVGLMLSFKEFTPFILFALLIGSTYFIKYFITTRNSLLFLYITTNIPLLFLSTQDFTIRLFVLGFIFYTVNSFLGIFPKKLIKIKNESHI